MTKSERLRETAITALLECRTEREAAERIPISLRTLKRMLGDEQFQQEFRAARRQLIRAATSRLRRNMDAAAKTLTDISTNPTVPPGVRVTASDKIIEWSLRAEEIEDLGERLDALEKGGAS